MQDWSNNPSPSFPPSHTAEQDPWHQIISQADRSLIPSIKKLVVDGERAAEGQ